MILMAKFYCTVSGFQLHVETPTRSMPALFNACECCLLGSSHRHTCESLRKRRAGRRHEPCQSMMAAMLCCSLPQFAMLAHILLERGPQPQGSGPAKRVIFMRIKWFTSTHQCSRSQRGLEDHTKKVERHDHALGLRQLKGPAWCPSNALLASTLALWVSWGEARNGRLPSRGSLITSRYQREACSSRYADMHIYMCIYIYTICSYMYMYTYENTYKHIYIYVYIRMSCLCSRNTCTYTFTCIYIHTYTYMYSICVYIYTCISTNTDMYSLSLSLSQHSNQEVKTKWIASALEAASEKKHRHCLA